ncbi:hypothetical protein CMI47_09785 [Candidatus Pacearchaeota archaeon]|nr:hypothetical protein [Candidatus Pacearchaeota archaeon]
MKRNIIYMVNIVLDDRSKTQGYEWSIRSWKNWADKNNCELFVLDQPIYDLSEMKPQWHKLLVFDLLENEGIDYDQILFVDSDTIVHPDCPNFFETSENKYCGVTAVGSMDWICRSIENYSTYLFDGYTFPYWKYINSGFMIMNKTHKPLFKSILNFYFANQERITWMQNNLGVGTDQPIINFFLNKENVNCKLLPYEYNMQDMMRLEALGEDMLHTKYGWVYHFNAGVKPSPGAWLEHTYNYLYGI